MYYDINRLISEEIKGIDMLLEALEECSDEEPEGSLFVRITSKGMVYHLKEKVRKGKYRSVKLGDERDPEVIRYKQSRYNRELKKRLLANKELLKSIEGKYASYDPDSIDEGLEYMYRDGTGLVNKNPGMMSDEEWQELPYRSNSISYGDDPNVAFDGQPVRSKSEIIIYNLAKMLGLPRHYEEDVGIYNEAGEKVYKNFDFRFRDKHMVIVALEHLGKLTDERCFENAMHKLRLYIKNGYRLNDTLLLTADDANGKIDSYSIVRLLKARFEIDF